MAGKEQDFRSKIVESLPELDRQRIASHARAVLSAAAALELTLIELGATEVADPVGGLVASNPFFKKLAYPNGPELVHGYDDIAARLLNATHDTAQNDVQRVFNVIHPAQ